ncbi:MAG: DNA-processing protein DprA [Candidatus Margulisiibacteriota bacterium]
MRKVNNLKYWLALNKIEGLGPISIKKLFEHFGSIEKVWFASLDDLEKIEGLRPEVIRKFLEHREKIDLEEELRKIKGIEIFCLEDSDYPAALRNIYDPPPVIYVKGKIPENIDKAIAIVGTRKASHYGKAMAYKLANELSSLGFVIVSGLAIGIDTEAHEGALASKGKTLAILGSGVDCIYPRSNIKLAKRIACEGALISEFPLGSKPEAGFFPRRNRIISGLSRGVIVVEGYYDSGAMITAKLALEQGREVFAVPGNVEFEQSKGPHWLIKQGAKLVESVEDVLEELQLLAPRLQKTSKNRNQVTKKDYSGLSEDERKIISVLSNEPKHLDVISTQTNFPISKVSSLLTMMEIKKVVRQLPGKNFLLS